MSNVIDYTEALKKRAEAMKEKHYSEIEQKIQTIRKQKAILDADWDDLMEAFAYAVENIEDLNEDFHDAQIESFEDRQVRADDIQNIIEVLIEIRNEIRDGNYYE